MYILKLFILSFMVLKISCIVYDKCSLAKKLLDLDVPTKYIPTLVCIAKMKSGFNTKHQDGGDWGIFGVNHDYWCHPDKNAILNTRMEDMYKYRCLTTCPDLLNSLPIATTCALGILKVEGEIAWGFRECENLDIEYLRECDKFMMLNNLVNRYCHV